MRMTSPQAGQTHITSVDLDGNVGVSDALPVLRFAMGL